MHDAQLGKWVPTTTNEACQVVHAGILAHHRLTPAMPVSKGTTYVVGAFECVSLPCPDVAVPCFPTLASTNARAHGAVGGRRRNLSQVPSAIHSARPRSDQQTRRPRCRFLPADQSIKPCSWRARRQDQVWAFIDEYASRRWQWVIPGARQTLRPLVRTVVVVRALLGGIGSKKVFGLLQAIPSFSTTLGVQWSRLIAYSAPRSRPCNSPSRPVLPSAGEGAVRF